MPDRQASLKGGGDQQNRAGLGGGGVVMPPGGNGAAVLLSCVLGAAHPIPFHLRQGDNYNCSLLEWEVSLGPG